MAAPSTLTAPPDVQALMKDWQDAFFKTMQDRMQVLMGDAPPQLTAGTWIQQNMGINELRQLSPSSGREEQHEDSPLMLKPPTSITADQVPDAEIAKCSSWLEAFAARCAHSATISFTSLETVCNFLQKVIIFLRSSVAIDFIKNDGSLLDDLLLQANSTVLEAQLMSHDAGITATELYTHLHMLRRRTVPESSMVDLPQWDKDRLLVMYIGGNDLFSPYQFRSLPFGLSTAPREFIKTLAPVVQLLRTQGIRVHAYLDDWIIWADSPEESL